MSNLLRIVFALVSIAFAGAMAQAAQVEQGHPQAQLQALERNADFDPALAAVCDSWNRVARPQRYRCDELYGGAGVDG